MITGDHPETAAAVARDAGLTIDEPTIVSAEDAPEKFEEQWLRRNPSFLKQIDGVARCTPMQKLRIVEALKNSGQIVAVTGDGVNDVPALKMADIGIAMGERGTQSAREVSSIILSDDNFNTIVNAIKEGRQLFKNLRMSFEYLLLIHIPLVLTAALIPLVGFPLLYLPIHIVWLELIIHPTALLAFQSHADPKQTPKRSPKSFFSKKEALKIIVFGFAITAALGLTYLLGVNEDLHENHTRAKAIALLTFWSGAITLYLTKFRSQIANLLAGGSVLITIFLVQNSGKMASLHLLPLHLNDWTEISALVLALWALMVAMEKLRPNDPKVLS